MDADFKEKIARVLCEQTVTRFLLCSVLLICSICSSCNTSRNATQSVSANELHDLHLKFIAADALERGDGDRCTGWNQLNRTLHTDMHRLGDAVFSEALCKESDDVRISVVNCMGFSRPEMYDLFPKTKHVLASAPKI